MAGVTHATLLPTSRVSCVVADAISHETLGECVLARCDVSIAPIEAVRAASQAHVMGDCITATWVVLESIQFPSNLALR